MRIRQISVFLSSCALAITVLVSPTAAHAQEVALRLDPHGFPMVGSMAAMVVNQNSGETLFEQHSNRVMPIASITKLMTAMVVLDARQSFSETLTVTAEDIDRLKNTGSRLSVGSRLTREEMMHIMLMSSENRAASALARHYPGGREAFINAMNVKARMIGLWDTRFADSSGLDPRNVSTPRDLIKLVSEATAYPMIRDYSTQTERHVRVGGGTLRFGNSNALARDPKWRLGLSKTGYIRESGRSVVMQAWVADDPVIIVLLNADAAHTRNVDAQQVRLWLEDFGGQPMMALASRGG